MIFPWITYRLPTRELVVWWCVGIGDLQCFTIGIWIIIGGPPLENFQRVWRSIPTKRHGQYQRLVGSITVPHSGRIVQPRIVCTEIFNWVYTSVGYLPAMPTLQYVCCWYLTVLPTLYVCWYLTMLSTLYVCWVLFVLSKVYET